MEQPAVEAVAVAAAGAERMPVEPAIAAVAVVTADTGLPENQAAMAAMASPEFTLPTAEALVAKVAAAAAEEESVG